MPGRWLEVGPPRSPRGAGWALPPLNAMAMSFSSTLEADAFTSSPAFWSTAMTSLLEIPRSLAISWTRFFAIYVPSLVMPIRAFDRCTERSLEAAAPLRDRRALRVRTQVCAASGRPAVRIGHDPIARAHEAQQL